MEIQKAHDQLVGMILGDAPYPPSREDADLFKARVNTAAGVLCWVLEHNHNPAFGLFLRDLTEYHRSIGIEVVDKSS